jgi:hypothetical protein
MKRKVETANLLILLIIPLLVITPTVANSLLTPFSDKSWRYNAGFEQGFLAIPFKGHHTADFVIGYINGTSTFNMNRSENPGHNMEWYVRYHNGAIDADNEYGSSNENDNCPSGHTLNYCSGYHKGRNADTELIAK